MPRRVALHCTSSDRTAIRILSRQRLEGRKVVSTGLSPIRSSSSKLSSYILFHKSEGNCIDLPFYGSLLQSVLSSFEGFPSLDWVRFMCSFWQTSERPRFRSPTEYSCPGSLWLPWIRLKSIHLTSRNCWRNDPLHCSRSKFLLRTSWCLNDVCENSFTA